MLAGGFAFGAIETCKVDRLVRGFVSIDNPSYWLLGGRHQAFIALLDAESLPGHLLHLRTNELSSLHFHQTLATAALFNLLVGGHETSSRCAYHRIDLSVVRR